MRAKSLSILIAAAVGVFALSTSPAEAGGKKHKYRYNDCYRGGGWGYYQPRVRYYRPAYYYAPRPVYYYRPRPVVQFGITIGNRGYYR